VRRPLAVLALGLVALVSGGCQLLGLPGSSPDPELGIAYPDGCAAYELSPRRCKAIVERMSQKVGIAGREVTRIELLPDKSCGPPDPNILCGGPFVVRVRFRFRDGGSAEDSVFCGGIGGQYTILCTETPEIRISSRADGYRDIPCAGEPPDGCATPLPTLQPSAAKASRPIAIEARDVAIDHVGHYEIPLGQAVLPNGILTEARFSLRDPLTQALSVGDAGVLLDVRSVDPGAPPFENYYMRGWHEGTETVEAVVIFDVLSFEPGALLELRDILVR